MSHIPLLKTVVILIAQGDRKLVQLQSMVGYQQNDDGTESANDSSWLNTVDEEDKRGRVGMQWPWESDGSSKDNK